MRYRDRIAQAKARGKDAGKNAATWTRDGNTSDETVSAVRKGLAEGDPAILDQFNPPNLSGEWAGESPSELLGDLLAGDDADDEVMQAYEDAAQSAFWLGVEREYAEGK